MIMKILIIRNILLVYLLGSIVAVAQSNLIFGKITDSQSNKPLPYISVYLNNTSFSTQTDSLGNFRLSNIPTGKYNLVASMVGYQTFFQTITFGNKTIEPLTIKLQIAENALSEVSVKAKRDRKWEKQLKTFENDFFGNGSFKKQCKILNSWVLDFEEKPDKSFLATASQPLEVENRALGYKVFYDLRQFRTTGSSFNLQGLVRFQELGYANEKRLQQYEYNRNIAYIGSERHFLKSLATGTFEQEGFAVFSVNDTFLGNGTASHLKPQLGHRLLPFSDSLLVVSTLNSDIVAITLPKEIEILNRNEQSYENTYQDAPYPVS
jgi:hypothetical protein